MCECFGAIEDITEEGIYRESYDLFTKGVNMLITHAVWYNASEEKVKFKPELSYRHDYYGKLLPEYNKYCAEVQSRLQNGGQVNSVAVLYPIESLQYMYTLNWEGTPQLGGPTSEKNNYLRLGQGLSRELNCDYTFLHPEVLQQNCRIVNFFRIKENRGNNLDFGILHAAEKNVICVQILSRLSKNLWKH